MAEETYAPLPLQRPPTHPGEILREDVLPAIGIPIAQAARELGISRQTLYAILREEAPVTPAMALRIGKFCGNGPEIWLRLQQAYDLWHAEQTLRDALDRIPTHREVPAGDAHAAP